MSTSDTHQQKSHTLATLPGSPKTVCSTCPNALRTITQAGDLRVYCRLMHMRIDEDLKACDGNPEPSSC